MLLDRRITFVLVFFFTTTSTVLVAAVARYVGHGWLTTALYSLVTMWITGIISQLVFHSLYQNIVKPMEDEFYDQANVQEKLSIDLDSVQTIQQVEDLATAVQTTQKEAREAALAGQPMNQQADGDDDEEPSEY